MSPLISQKSRVALWIAAFFLCSFSLTASVLLWVLEQQTVPAMVMAGFAAGGVELCKFAFFPIAANLKRFMPIFSAVLYITGTLLLIFSIFATVAFLETGSQGNISAEKTGNFTYQTKRKDIENIEKEIQSNIENKENAISQGIVSKSSNIDQRIDELKRQKEKKVSELNTLEVIPDKGMNALFKTMNEIFGISVALARTITYVIGSIIVDVCSIFCLMVLNANRVESSGGIGHNQQEYNMNVKPDDSKLELGDRPFSNTTNRRLNNQAPNNSKIELANETSQHEVLSNTIVNGYAKDNVNDVSGVLNQNTSLDARPVSKSQDQSQDRSQNRSQDHLQDRSQSGPKTTQKTIDDEVVSAVENKGLRPLSRPVSRPPKKDGLEVHVERVLKGEFGDNPGVNLIAKSCKVGKIKAKKILDEVAKIRKNVIPIK